MEYGHCHDGGRSPAATNFAFAFNDSNFSDRILRIEVMAEPSAVKTEEGACSIADWARNRKRRRADAKKEAVEVSFNHCEQIMLNSQQEADEVGPIDNLDDDAAPMMEESCVATRPVNDQGTQWTDTSAVLWVKTLHISSAILAAESPFFFKLFSNCNRDSDKREVTLRTTVSEEPALMDMLQFIYTGRLQANSAFPLLDVLMAADKYEVASCVRQCSKLLQSLPMTPESALLYLDLPSNVFLPNALQPLTDAAALYLVSQYKDVTRFSSEIMNLPLAGIEAIFSSDDIQVASEDNVYDFILKWAKQHYPNAEERREIIASRLIHLVRFPMMTPRKLRKVLSSSEIENEVASKLVLEALFYKSEASHRQRQLALEDTMYRKYIERAYRYRPVKLLEFDSPHQQCTVFLNLKKEECAALFPQGRVYSQAFHLGGQGFFLSAHCNMDQQSAFHCFGLFLGMQEKGSVSFSVDYEFAAREKPQKDFVTKYRGTYKFTGGKQLVTETSSVLPGPLS